ncbi:aspartyl protease family protein [Chitinophaga nivalis]|uniref:Aspartyl protease family protein n=1 Tax=Chitinophaga nivalis TaxID=2991709 RepID=A0ABT3IHR9_9BACT|nr:aspartyl protease family protein [Chitinophaga nivalis]MCW3466969.1 aspartyl protease family protein [Chitinophaga nivalis]MCW3483340.1 aspartyl protease family protein [Chitinophaga nivalis]
MKTFKFIIIVCSVLMMIHTAVQAQDKLPVIKATSRTVDVMDGDDFRKGVWRILPDKKPDLYYVIIPHKPHRVMFRTDVDSIAFDTQYNGVYDFIILLNNRDSCFTRIVAKENDLLHFTSNRKSEAQKSDTIPITIGSNDKIFISGSINGSAPLNFQFDLGAGGNIIKKGSLDKIKLKFDGKTILINSDGRHEVPTSSKNTLTVGSMRWENNITWVVGDNMDRGEDGLLGNSLFLDKVVELNYDRKIMVIHDTMPEIGKAYTQHGIILDAGVVPFIQASIKVNGILFTDWYMFDTGFSGYLRISSVLYEKHQLNGKVEKAFSLWGTRIVLPGFEVGGKLFSNVKTLVKSRQPNDSPRGLMGNRLLKRFNVLLDNRNGYIYLKPNSLLHAPDRSNTLMPWIVSITLFLIILFAVAWIIRKRKRSRSMV